jgi:osmoprotectant transport system substrate-binding protein
MAQMYSELLQAKGFTTTIKTVTNRELYEPALENGQIDVVPDYAATMAEFLNTKVNGPNAAPVATTDATTTVAALNKLANPLGLTALTPAQAVDQNAFVVSQAFATQHSLKTLSDLAALKMPITLAAVEECLTRKFCGGVLKDNYGMTIKEVLPTGFDTLPTKKAVQDGTAQLGLVGSTDATLSDFNLVILTDDKKVQLADNLTPIVGKKYANDADLTAALNALSATLTTDDLVTMIRDVDTQRELPADVAKSYLTSKGLL